MTDSRSYFEEIAPRWDEMRQRFFSDELRQKVLAAGEVDAGSSAADLGAGTGFLTAGLLELGAAVIAVDQAAAMLTEMRKRFAGAPGLDLRQGAADRLPIRDGEVDRAFANMVLHHVEDPALAIREMARILGPGGRLVVSDLDCHDFEFLRREQHDRWLGFERSLVRRWFEEAGLENVRIFDAAETCCAESECGSETAQVTIFIASGDRPLAAASPHGSSVQTREAKGGDTP